MTSDHLQGSQTPEKSGNGPQIAHVYVMLSLFFSTFLVLLVVQLLVSKERVGQGATGHSPTEFPEIF
ncbi:MAG: hypothetical protein ACYTFG_17860, partial [Planctomycetota bacterium]